MIVAQNWRDYALLDAGDGEKLERFGEYIVMRPDPQAFWPRSHDWQKPDLHYHRSPSGGGSWSGASDMRQEIAYEKLRFIVRPTGFKHMGIFPEQAANWLWLIEKLSDRRRAKVLNLFAYTGAATLACLSASAHVTHVDASKGMNQWARENIALNGFESCRIITDDCRKFVQREARRGSKYDGIIMDPPSFGRGPGGQVWKLEGSLYTLISECRRILSDRPLFFLLNAYTAGHSATAFENVLRLAFRDMSGSFTSGEVGLRAQSGMILPCGMFARFEVTD